MGLLGVCFTNILRVSFTSSIIALAILMLRQIVKKRINISYIHLLVVLVLLRFCLVIVPESPISILSIIPNYDKIEKTIPDGMATTQNYVQNHTNQNSKENNIQENYIKNDNIGLDGDTYIDKSQTISKIQNILAMIWMVGVILMALAVLVLQLRLKLELNNSKPLCDSRLADIVEECKDSLGIKGHVRVFVGDKFNGPCITGIIRPCIYYPCSLMDIDVDSFKNIILHELSHFKRRDLLTNNIALLAISLHWFNPIIWILMKVYRVDVELACDSYVLNKLGEKNAISYGSTILHIAKLNLDNTRSRGVVCYFSSSAKQLERRITLIKRYKNKSIKVTVTALLGSIIIGSAILTNPVSANGVSEPLKISQENSVISQEDILTKHELLRYYNLDRLYSDTGYKLIPSYLSKDKYDLINGDVWAKDMVARLTIIDRTQDRGRYNLIISRVNPVDVEDIGDKTLIEPMTVGTLVGQKIICDNKYMQNEYFVYKIDDEYYGLNYKSTFEYENEKEVTEMPLDDVEHMLKTLVKVEDFDFTEYQSKDDMFMHTMKDMKYASEQLGFPIKIPRNNPILGTFGESSLFSKPIDGYESKFLSIHYDGKPGVSFTQSTTGGYYYEQFVATGSFNMRESEKGWFSDMIGEWITVDGQKTLKITEIYHPMKHQEKGDYVNNYIIKVNDNHFFRITCTQNSNEEEDIKLIKELLKTEYEVFK